MTPEELDQHLRQLSEHEKQYRDGVSPAPITGREFVDMGGVSVMRSTYWTGASLTGPLTGVDYVPRQGRAALVRVKRHSRFREYPLHFHDFVELAYMYDGTCMETVNDRLMGIRAGQVLLVDSGVVHTIAPLREGDILVNVQIEKGFLNAGFFNRMDSTSLVTSFFVNAISKGVAHDSYILFRSQGDRRLRTFMTEFLCECLDPSPHGEGMAEALFSVVLAELVNVYERGAEQQLGSDRYSVVPILRYIEENYRSCTLKGTADEFCMSTSSLTKLLRRECDSTFKELVQQQRMAAARTLLANDELSVTDVARNVGYSNMTFFYKVFDRQFGMSPGGYRTLVHGK